MMVIGMFDEVKTVRVEETANGKRFVTDEESLEEIELTEASIALGDAEAKGYLAVNSALDVVDVDQVLHIDASVHPARSPGVGDLVGLGFPEFRRYRTNRRRPYRAQVASIVARAFEGDLGRPRRTVQRSDALGCPVPRPVGDERLDVVGCLARVRHHGISGVGQGTAGAVKPSRQGSSPSTRRQESPLVGAPVRSSCAARAQEVSTARPR